MLPFVHEVPYADPLAATAACRGLGDVVLLDSALRHERFGRRSHLFVDPFERLLVREGRTWLGEQELDQHWLALLEERLGRCRGSRSLPHDLLPGAAAGYLGYELGASLEATGVARAPSGFPDLLLGLHDLVVTWDHFLRRTWIVSTGHRATGDAPCPTRASERLDLVRSRIEGAAPLDELDPVPAAPAPLCDIDRGAYEAAVQRIIDYILAGDIYQANLSQRFRVPITRPPFDLYRSLRAANPAPFSAWIDMAGVEVASTSPERFLGLRDGRVETRPIKGTRPRGASEVEDEALGAELLGSAKDRAENVMIVDLLRNDLSRVCRDHTVRVPELCIHERYASVHHLVSTVLGELRSDAGAVDLLRATFPGGSITGAPKIRAMEILAELEPVQRGPYCGCIGYLAFDGSMDTSIVIRTVAFRDAMATLHAGGGITAASDPGAEYDETLDKAVALLGALGCSEHDLQTLRRPEPIP